MTASKDLFGREVIDEPVYTPLSTTMTLLFAISVGVIVTNLFAPQTLVGVIGPALDFNAASSGFLAMATLLGYAAGLTLLVPLADLLENRALVLRLLAIATLAATIAALAPNAAILLLALFILGAACSAIQILVPIAAAMTPPARRGRVIGDVMSGLMVGILLARPLASLVAAAWGWRAFYGLSAVSLVTLTSVLALLLPVRRPVARSGYLELIASLWHLLRSEPVLRRRALTASLMMAGFSLFWTSVALRLVEPPFNLDQAGIALFALAGAGGAAVTSLFGWAGDRGWTRAATIGCHLTVIVAAGLAAIAGSASEGTALLPLGLLCLSAILLDIGAIGDQTLGRRAINLLNPEARGRINGLFVGLFFLGGAAGSGISGLAWAAGGWSLTCIICALFGLAAIAIDCL